MQPLIHTVIDRPYVITFLVTYLILATRAVGLGRTLLFLVTGYTIAFVSEYLSINYGFPYGWYFYKYENLQRDWLNHGVPVWDSASYVFMCFAGFYLALFMRRHKTHDSGLSKLKLILLSATLVTLLDVIIDPVSHLGGRWFLGEIYYYPDPGWYFDITMANFGGWFLVSFLINSVGCFVLNFDKKMQFNTLNHLLGLGLYFGIFGFGLVIAIYLKEWALVLCDLAWLGFVLSFVIMPQKRKTTINQASTSY